MVAILNEKFVPYAQPWRGPREEWVADAWERFGKKREGGLGFGTEFVITTSAGRAIPVKVGEGQARDRAAQGLKAVLEAYAQLPEAERRPKTVAGENKPMPAPPPGGLVFTTYDRVLERDEQGRYRIRLFQWADKKPASYGQRSTLWLAEDECKTLIPQNPRPGETHRVPTKLSKRIGLFGLCPQTLWMVEGSWQPNSVRKEEITLTVEEVSSQAVRMRIHGSVVLVVKASHLNNVENRYDARLEGILVYDRITKTIAKWDMAAVGDYTGEWLGGGWVEATPDKPVRLGFSFELDRSDYEFPERRRPPGYLHSYIFGGVGGAKEKWYWDPEKWEADSKKQ